MRTFATGEGLSGTTRNIIIATSNVVTAKIQNRSRQIKFSSNQAVGDEAQRTPNPPAVMCNPLANGKRSDGNHWTNDLKAAIKHAETPRPINARL